MATPLSKMESMLESSSAATLKQFEAEYLDLLKKKEARLEQSIEQLMQDKHFLEDEIRELRPLQEREWTLFINNNKQAASNLINLSEKWISSLKSYRSEHLKDVIQKEHYEKVKLGQAQISSDVRLFAARIGEIWILDDYLPLIEKLVKMSHLVIDPELETHPIHQEKYLLNIPKINNIFNEEFCNYNLASEAARETQDKLKKLALSINALNHDVSNLIYRKKFIEKRHKDTIFDIRIAMYKDYLSPLKKEGKMIIKKLSAELSNITDINQETALDKEINAGKLRMIALLTQEIRKLKNETLFFAQVKTDYPKFFTSENKKLYKQFQAQMSK